MASIKQLSDYSLLAMASYAKSLNTTAPLSVAAFSAKLLEAGFTQPQIDSLSASGWQVVSQSEDTQYGDGFSATLFQNAKTGEFVFANRGTVEFGADLIRADAWGIALMGTAGGQIVDMIRYYKRLITPEGQSVSYTQDELQRMYGVASWYHPGGYSSVADLANALVSDRGLGKISVNQKLTIDGHSLGGHLSIWFKAFFDSKVDEVYTFNGAGLGGAIRSAGTLLAGAFGNVSTAIADARVTNIFGDGGPAIIAGVGGSVGTNIGARIEAKDSISSLVNKLYNHSVVTLSDALAAPALLQTLDPTLTLGKTNAIVDSASNQIPDTQERAIDAVRRLFGFVSTTGTDDRDDFYVNLKALTDSSAFQSIAGKVRIDVTNAGVGSKARDDFSALASLITLSPIVMTATDSANKALVDAVLQSVWGKAYSDWQIDKNMSLADRQAGKQTYTDKWITDRTAMLSWMMTRNQQDVDWVGGGTGAKATHFKDAGSGIEFDLGVPNVLVETRQILFGGIGADSLSGKKLDDDLYGSAGADTLLGQGGNDYLEGNADNDTLDGGEGNDLLMGGQGTDLYKFTGTWGRDTIEDSDGLGTLQVEGFAAGLPQGKKIGTGKYQSTDSKVTYTLAKITDTRTDLAIAFTGRTDTLTIRNWSPGQFGIPAFDETPVPATSVVIGDTHADINDVLSGTSGADQILGLTGNDALSGGDGNDVIEGGIGTDILAGGRGADVLNGGDGRDFIFGSATASTGWSDTRPDWMAITGNAWSIPGVSRPVADDEGNIIDAGAGDDWVGAGTGNDVVRAGPGSDLVYAMGGDDYVDGGDDADELHGDASILNTSGSYIYSPPERHGNDTLVGGGGNDTLFGEGGADELYGGADNDVMYGDADKVTVPVEFHGNDTLDGGDGDDQLWGDGGNDELFGGTGNDTLQGDARADDLPGSAHGADYLDGEEGNDVLFGEGGADTLYGGIGDDMLVGDTAESDPAYQLAAQFHGNDYLDGEEGNDTLWGGGGNDELFGGTGNDTLQGDARADDLPGSAHGADYLDGEEGNDVLFGEGGADTLYGGIGDDMLVGDTAEADPAYQLAAQFHGNDYLDGGDGNDTVYGNGGADQLFGGIDDHYLDIEAGRESMVGGRSRRLWHGDKQDSALLDIQGRHDIDCWGNKCGLQGRTLSGAANADLFVLRRAAA